ncbi:MAG: hypothetical protein LBJ67_11520 [Planctomycetaceae bacterium]|jgi:hypothetical protein|nr:hypothetical protein [Planctomycetaceae bacterium]
MADHDSDKSERLENIPEQISSTGDSFVISSLSGQENRTPTNYLRKSVKHTVVPASNRFLVMFVGVIGVLLIVMSIGFGIFSIFAPSDYSAQEEIAQEFPGINATLAAKNMEINEELLTIIREGTSLNQLMNKNISVENDLRQILADSFREVNWETELKSLRRDVARNPWQIGLMGLENHLTMLRHYNIRRQRVRQILNDPATDMQPIYSKDKHGFGLKEEDRDLLWGYTHLEEYEVARAMTGLTLDQISGLSKASAKTDTKAVETKPNIAEAVNALCYILKTAEIASRQREINLRLTALFIRENALDILQALVRSPEFDRDAMQKIFQYLERQIQEWPPDTLLFEGERTSGVWFYEVIRRGGLYEIAVPEDIAAIEKIGSPFSIEQTMRKRCNSDELFYLRQINKLIQINRLPLEKRFALLTQWEDEIETLRSDVETYPIVAGTLLFRDVRKIMLWLAEDRTRIQAWTLAISKAMEQPTEKYEIHPVTGQPFRVSRTQDEYYGDELISVSWQGNALPIEVPMKNQSSKK